MAECVAQSLSQTQGPIYSLTPMVQKPGTGDKLDQCPTQSPQFCCDEFKAPGSWALKLFNRPLLAALKPFISGWGAAV